MWDCCLVVQHLGKALLEKDEVNSKVLMGKKEDTVKRLIVAMR